MPSLGDEYEIQIETTSKPKADYMTDEYFELDLPVAPAVMVGDEIVVEGEDISTHEIESTICRHLGLPDPILRKPPSADLWPDQSDEEELGLTYDEVDRLLALLVDARTSRATAIARGFAADLVDRVTRLIVRSQFKRRPPVIAKLSSRSVGWEFRYPRDWLT